jgi:hypothetical protein
MLFDNFLNGLSPVERFAVEAASVMETLAEDFEILDAAQVTGSMFSASYLADGKQYGIFKEEGVWTGILDADAARVWQVRADSTVELARRMWLCMQANDQLPLLGFDRD